jgi:glycosyltransferase involved in cell wall biosynthesis
MKKNIAFLVNSLEGGGAEKTLTIISNKLSEKCYNILIITLSSNAPIYPLSKNIKTIHLNSQLYKRISVIYKIYDLIKSPFIIKKILNDHKIDILISVLFRPHIINIATKAVASIKSIIWEHSIQSMGQGKSKIGKYLISQLYRRADNIITVANTGKNDLVENFNIRKSMIDILHNPIEIDKINILKKEPIDKLLKAKIKGKYVISFAGRLTEAKNLTLLVEAIYKLRNLNIIVLIIGDGEEMTDLSELVDNYKLTEKFIFLGWQLNPYKYIQNSNCFVLPSKWESFGNVVVEALACNVTVITSDAFALKEMNDITNNSTILFRNNNIDSLSNKLRHYYNDLNKNKLEDIDFDQFNTSKITRTFLQIIGR